MREPNLKRERVQPLLGPEYDEMLSAFGMSSNDVISAAEVRNLMQAEIVKARGLRALARKWKVSAAFLSDVMHGRRYLGARHLKRFGLRKVPPPITEPTYLRLPAESEASRE